MSRAKKILAGGVIALLVGLIVLWQVTGPKVIAGVKDRLITQMNASVNGRITIENVNFSAFGAAVLQKVVLFDKAGTQVATCEELDVSYKFSDLLNGRFGMDSVNSITLNRLVLKLGIDKNGRWSLQDLVKPQAERPAAFVGVIKLRDSAATVTTPDWKRDFSEISGDLDYEKQPNIAFDLKGKSGKSSMTAKGTLNLDDKSQFALKIDTLDLVDAQSMLPAGNRPKVGAGTMKDIQLAIIRDKAGIQSTGDAVLSGLAIDLQGLQVKDGAAKIKLQGNKVDLSDASATVDGQKMNITGSIDFAPTSPQLALQISAAAFNIGAASGSQAALTGTASFRADITGTADKPSAKGTFQLPSGKLDTLPISNGSGAFRYEGETMTIENATAGAFDGTIGVSGTLVPKTSNYNLKVSGQNVDSAILTDKGITGRMDFNANVSGQGTASSMIAEGTFAMKAATLAEYAISNAAGGFKKKGNRLDLSNVGLSLSGQRLSVGGVVTLAPAGAQPQINLNISSAGLDAAVFNPNSALKAVIAFQANITGTPDKNQARGTFQIGSGALGQLAFSGASGGFSYVDGTLTLSGARANFLSGTITMNGTVVPKTMQYRQQITGQNVDAALLTDRDVQGRADFNATISGQGDWDKANGDGDFKMNSGSVKNIAFNALTGNFTKRGKQTDFTNLKFQMAGGLASGTGNTEGEYINLVITPNAVANAALSILTGKTLPVQNLRIRFRGPNG